MLEKRGLGQTILVVPREADIPPRLMRLDRLRMKDGTSRRRDSPVSRSKTPDLLAADRSILKRHALCWTLRTTIPAPPSTARAQHRSLHTPQRSTRVAADCVRCRTRDPDSSLLWWEAAPVSSVMTDCRWIDRAWSSSRSEFALMPPSRIRNERRRVRSPPNRLAIRSLYPLATCASSRDATNRVLGLPWCCQGCRQLDVLRRCHRALLLSRLRSHRFALLRSR